MFSLLAGIGLGMTTLDSTSYDCLKWRCIGPFRGGRTVGADGIADQPNTFFIGVNNGGVWKTTDAGRTWVPIFDDQPTGSIGQIAVAPSNPKVIYVGSGEGLQRPDLSTGDGMYRTSDGGKTWTHLGLRNGQQISGLAVDEKNENRVFAAVLGHPYGPNEERGLYRTLDGGKTWKKVLGKDENTGAVTVAIDPKNSKVVYCALWEARQGPWENGAWQGPGSGLFKSIDGGDTWKQLVSGLPTVEQGLGRIGISISRSNPKRIYAIVDAPSIGGIYRSDNAGEDWVRVNSESRLWGRGSDFAEIRCDPKNANIVYVGNTSTYRSNDGGETFVCIKGSPGGDDYHTIWINPKHPENILLAADQGATISVNGGETWSSWYNQPTAQFYHVITDNQMPYRVYGGQQESGSAGVLSRGRNGHITFRDWVTVGADEYAYVAPDPLNPNLIYGGKMSRFHLDTGQVDSVGPDRQKLGLRFLRTSPLIFSPVDKKTLFLGAQKLLKTTDGGGNWEVISPDLSREQPETPASVGKYRTPEVDKMARRGVIYTVAPSHQDLNRIWCGTDDGLIHITSDGGKSWSDITPRSLTPWSKVSMIDAGHFDNNTAYAAINRIRLDDQKPHILRTHDGGKTWKEIVNGLPDGPVNTVREDPKRPGLLFCGTELAVFFSLDDGENWQPLRLNMPATSIRDLVIHEDDVVVGTHGRSFWILDNFSLIRQLPDAKSGPVLFAPPAAYQWDRSLNTDTPLPPEEPAGQNPPDGAMLDYLLPADAGTVEIEIVGPNGATVRKFSSKAPTPTLDPKVLTVMPEWARPFQSVSTKKGSHRFIWDLRNEPPSDGRGLPISAIWRDTPFQPQGSWVEPGRYTIKLTVDGKSMTQTLDVKPNPIRS